MRVRGLFSLVYNPTSLFAPFHKKIQVIVSLLLLHSLTKIILTSIIKSPTLIKITTTI